MSYFQFNLRHATRWEKVRGADNQYRYYELALQQDIFGEWEVAGDRVASGSVAGHPRAASGRAMTTPMLIS